MLQPGNIFHGSCSMIENPVISDCSADTCCATETTGTSHLDDVCIITRCNMNTVAVDIGSYGSGAVPETCQSFDSGHIGSYRPADCDPFATFGGTGPSRQGNDPSGSDGIYRQRVGAHRC